MYMCFICFSYLLFVLVHSLLRNVSSYIIYDNNDDNEKMSCAIWTDLYMHATFADM